MLTFGDILVYVTVFFGLYTSIFFLITLLQHRDHMRPRTKVKYESVCIIVPCYNEEGTVAKTLDSLLRLDYPKDKLQIVVVDDGSTDSTYKIASQYAKRGAMNSKDRIHAQGEYLPRVKVLRKPNGGKFTALNYALERTKSVYVGALDADSFVDRHALKRMMPYFAEARVMAVTPSMKVDNPKHWLQKVQWTEFLIGIFLRKIFAFLGSIHVTPGPFSIYRRTFFRQHGLYRHAHNTEDIEMALRIQSRNYEIENAHDAYVYTVGPDSFKALWNQRLRWYYGFLRNTEDYRQLFSVRHGVLGIFVLPASFLSVVLVMVGMFYAVTKIAQRGWEQLVYLRATGYNLQLQWNFDAFFLSLDSVAVLSAITLLTGIVLILVAKYIAGERRSIIRYYAWFIVSYWILFGIWWIAAVLMRVTGRKMTWRHKSEG